MPDVIRDGTGTSKLVKVSSDNRLLVSSVVKSEEANIALTTEDAFCGTTGDTVITYPNGTYLYLKNTSATKLLIIERLLVSCSATKSVVCRRNDTGTPGDTTTIPQVNTNFSSSNTAPAELYTTDGTGITGLTDGGILAAFDDVASGFTAFPVDGTFILGKDNVFTVSTLTAVTGDLSWTLRYRFVPV